MFGRIFGRDKDDSDQAVCAECGRTLLAGEWTQTVVDADGHERLICSLCGQNRDFGDAPPTGSAAPANNGRVRETRSEAPGEGTSARGESDAFWIALRDKDAEIERLHEQLARAEAEKQELSGRLARLGAAAADPTISAAALPAEPLVPTASDGPVVNEITGDSSEPGERTWGETPAEFAAELAALRDEPEAEPAPAAEEVVAEPAAGEEVVAEPAAEAEPAETPADGPPAVAFEDTQPIPALEDEELVAAGAEAEAAASAGLPGDAETTLAPEAEAGPSEDELAAHATSLTMLQRGVDLLNVSRVPRKVAETNEQLGLPSVHIGFDGQTVAATFMWPIGWYCFTVGLESGEVRLADRGYDERSDLQPNAAVRGDGTVQLAPAQISRAAAQRPPERAPEPEAVPAESAPAEPEPPSVAAQKPPEILSKSLLGQRSDDEAASWEQTQARDFDWDR